MKKAIVGLVTVGAVITMAAKCKQMMSGQSREGGETGGMRAHCKEMMAMHCEEMMAAHKAHGTTAETPEEGAPQFVGSGEAVGV